MKTFKKILLILVLAIFYVYITCLDAIPENLVLFEGESLSVPTILGMKISNGESETVNAKIETKEESKSNKNSYNEVGTYNLSVNIANLKLKNIEVNVISKESVVLSGNTIGAKLYTNGVLVVGMSEISDINNIKYKPYENTGIEEGDMIVEVNDKTVTCTSDLIKNVNKCEGKAINIKFIREGNEQQTSLLPVQTSKDEYKIGLWVRDAAARSRNNDIL